MPNRTDIHSIEIISAELGTIGWACEFDYSSAQDSHYLFERFVQMMENK
jgi:hypothetical protein